MFDRGGEITDCRGNPHNKELEDLCEEKERIKEKLNDPHLSVEERGRLTHRLWQIENVDFPRLQARMR